MRSLALAFAGSALVASLPAAAQTPPAPPVTVVVIPGGPQAAPPAPPVYTPPAPVYAPPPPGYVPAPPVYAPPGPYYAPTYVPLPAMERRSVGGMVAGIIGVSAGGVLLVSSAFAALIADATQCFDSGVGSCHQDQGPAIALGVSGGVAIAVGIPLIIWGARKVPVGTVAAGELPSPLPAWAGAPGGPGWRWRF
jgi:hypothetical protein